jgi:hypothetical protein
VHESAVCRTVTICPATVTVPLRAAPVFAPTATLILAVPFPPAAGVMDSHGVVLPTAHAQVGPITS